MKGRLLMSLRFIRLLCSELEICARYEWREDERDPSAIDRLIDRLTDNGHIMVMVYASDLPRTRTNIHIPIIQGEILEPLRPTDQ